MSDKVFYDIKCKIKKLKKKEYNNFDSIDFIILPTLSIKAPEIKKINDYEKYIFYNNLVLSNTRVANLFNFPAITIQIKKNYWLSFSVFCKEKKMKFYYLLLKK